MVNERTNAFVKMVSKTTYVKITGWSIKYSATSLLEYLASFGEVLGFVHYPQLITTYATLKVSNKCKDLSKLLAEHFPRAKLEFIPQGQILEAEKSLESPEKTAFISSRYLVSDKSLFRDLSQFGNLRVLNFYVSKISHKWLCKASFYENYPLDQLLNNQMTAKRTLCDGIHIKLERFRDSKASNDLPRLCQYRKTQEVNLVSTELKQQISVQENSQVLARPEYPTSNGRRVHDARKTKARSCDKSCQEQLPVYKTFKNSGFCIENAIKLHRSRRLEMNIPNYRSSSVGKLSDNQVKIKLASYAGRNMSKRRQAVVKEYTFEENELLFLEITNTPNNTQQPANSTFFNNNQHNACHQAATAEQVSYLSLDELSDGYSATEEGYGTMEIEETTIKLTPSANGSEKNASHILLTHCSSDDVDHLKPSQKAGMLPSPYSTSQDKLFSSSSGLDSGHVAQQHHPSRPWNGGNQASHFYYVSFTSPAY